MGDIKRILFETRLDPAPVLYAGKRTLETAESLHLHTRNLRLEFSRNEFAQFCADVRAAEQRWTRELGCPEPTPGASTKYLSVTDIADIPEAGHGGRLAVEECSYPTIPAGTVHVHLRDLRIEFTPDEWNVFAHGIIEAFAKWNHTR